jgi:hypothetical protein
MLSMYEEISSLGLFQEKRIKEIKFSELFYLSFIVTKNFINYCSLQIKPLYFDTSPCAGILLTPMLDFCHPLLLLCQIARARYSFHDCSGDEVARRPTGADRLARENDEEKKTRENDGEDARSRNRLYMTAHQCTRISGDLKDSQ